MCSMDRIENTNCSQLDFFREMQLTVNLSSHPACIRLRDGSFSHFNHSFATTFLHNINVNIWFNRLEISSSLRLSALDAEVYSGDRKMLIEENLPINGNRWDFIIERMSFDGTEFTLWKSSTRRFFTVSCSFWFYKKTQRIKKCTRFFN